MSYSRRIAKIVDMLSDRGFDKKASEIVEAKEAMFGDLPSYSPPSRRPLMHGQRGPQRPSPSDPDTPMYKKGDFVIELNPTTMKEELMMWNGRRLVPKKEIEDMIVKGVMREERLLPQYDKSSPEVKKAMTPLLELAEKSRTFSNVPSGTVGIPYSVQDKLAGITYSLEKRGYSLLVKKLKTAMSKYLRVSSKEEDHKIPSIEKVYEESDSPEDFDRRIKKLKGVHEKITDIVEDFEDNYKSEVLDKVLSKEISEDEAVKSTIGLVSEADKESDRQIDKISK